MHSVNDILRQLIRFPTVSSDSNMELIHYIQQLLQEKDIQCQVIREPCGRKANLFASTGPAHIPGILLSGHSDVVPVEGQQWCYPPFSMTTENGRIYGRGSCDMKGFLAAAVVTMLKASECQLQRPLQLAVSCDEEVGCVGVRTLLKQLDLPGPPPYLCIVGEPTEMQFALGHKGKTGIHACCTGEAGHSSRAPEFTNAVYLASDLIGILRDLQQQLADHGHRDEQYDIPYSTVHTGTINGGKALNIVPAQCELEFEIRTLPEDNIDTLLAQLQEQVAALVGRTKAKLSHSQADISLDIRSQYPGMETHPTAEAVRFMHQLSPPGTREIKVAFGTEGGHFSRHFQTPVVVCGPGSIAQAHKADEYLEQSQLEACEVFLSRLLATLSC